VGSWGGRCPNDPPTPNPQLYLFAFITFLFKFLSYTCLGLDLGFKIGLLSHGVWYGPYIYSSDLSLHPTNINQSYSLSFVYRYIELGMELNVLVMSALPICLGHCCIIIF